MLRRIKPKEKLTLKTVLWSAKMRFSCSRREAGLIEDRRKLYQSCKRFWRLKRVRICGQCWRYVRVMFSSLAGTRLAGMRIGSGCQLAAAFLSLAVEAGSEAVLELAWSDLLDLLADGASVVFLAVRFLVAAPGC